MTFLACVVIGWFACLWLAERYSVLALWGLLLVALPFI